MQGKNDYTQYVKRLIREGGIETEYDGFVKNKHPSLTFEVICFIETHPSDKYDGYRKSFIIPPLTEKMVMSHDCGPTMFNEYDFRVLEIKLVE